MSSKARMCLIKKRYRDIEQVKSSLSRSQRSERGKKAVRYYECPECQGYHLTSQPFFY